MVKAFAGSKKLNVTKLDFDRLLDGKNAYTNSTTIRVDYKNTKERERFDGKFSANPSAKTISGSATGWTLRNYKTDDVVFRFTGRNLLSASVVLAAAKTKTLKDDHKIIEKMLAGNDSFDGSRFDDVLYGYRGDDTFQGGAGKDRFDGGSGSDVADYAKSSKEVTVALDGGDWVSVSSNGVLLDRMRYVEGVSGGKGNDTLTGDKLANKLSGNEGDDTLSGGKGNDTISGGKGSDSILGGKGNDSLLGGNGDDHVEGGKNNDFIDGGKGNDYLDGGKDSDTVNGGNGNDTLLGKAGSDSLNGGKGVDLIEGGTGRDTMTGGADADTFRFGAVTDSNITATTRDFITDFKHKLDKIDVSAIDAITSVVGLDDGFVLDKKISSNTKLAEGHLGWYQVNASGTANDRTFIVINNDGDKAADMTIELNGLVKLGAVDFIV
jgi:Ca2+-binding RTX toxin-like protein